jgi:general stress protein CsbA
MALSFLFPSNIPVILSARLMKSDWLDYVNAVLLLILLRLTKLKIYWKTYFLLPNKIVKLINKPIYILQKRHNFKNRIISKLKG